MKTGVRLATMLALALGLVSARASASEAPLSADDSVRLMHGAAITREETLDKDDRHYVGGVVYAVVDAKSDELESLLENVDAYRAILPYTKEARLVGRDQGDLLVELTQGNFLFAATYTVRIHHEGRTVRFWLDRSLPHGIDDAWGFFRWEPLAQVKPGTPRALLTYGILVDIGPGVVRDLFEERIRRVVLTVPARVREYVGRELRRTLPRA